MELYSRLSTNPNITWDIVKTNPDKPWDYSGLSVNPNITWDIVLANPDKPWNYRWLSSNKMSRYEWPLPIIKRRSQERCRNIKEELMAAVFDPDRMDRFGGLDWFTILA